MRIRKDDIQKWLHRHTARAGFAVVGFLVMAGMLAAAKDNSSGYQFILMPNSQPNTYDLGEKISEGVALLKSSPPLQYETANGADSGELLKRQIAFAILDKKTGDVFEKRVWIEEKDVKRVKETGIVPLFPVEGEMPPINISVGWWNSFNSFYTTDDSNLVIVANKYLVKRDSLPEQSNILLSIDEPLAPYMDMVYVPYSEAIHWPSIIKLGKQYIEERLDKAYAKLEQNKIKSLSNPSKLVSDVIDRKLITDIVLTEHVDTKSLLLADDGGRRLAERVLVIVGANKEWAYRYTGSLAGATGIAQFMESTYKSMLAIYPEAGLIRDYELGMADHSNAFMAMILFLDSHKKILQDSVQDKDILEGGITDEMLAATYNGGPNRTIRSINKYGTGWEESTIFRKETRDYIKKYDKIRALNIF